MLRMLSMNSRVTVSEMSRSLGVPRQNVMLRLSKIEKHFGIRYTLEIDPAKIGLTEPHLIAVRFRHKPDYARIKRLLSESGVAQLAVSASGKYDLLIYANAFSKTEYYSWDARMRSTLVLYYGARWEESEISYQRLGFFPIRNEVINRSRLKPKDKAMLAMLNDNSRAPLKKISRAAGINYKTVAYRLKRLMSGGIIKRFTISLGIHEHMFPMAIFGRFIPPEDSEGVARTTQRLFTSDDPDPLVNKYQATAALMGSYGFFAFGVFKNRHRAYNDLVLEYKRTYRRFGYTESSYAELRNVLLGVLPLRNVDPKAVYRQTL